MSNSASDESISARIYALLAQHQQLCVEGLSSAALAYVLAAIRAPSLLIVLPDSDECEVLADNLAAFGCNDVVLFPGDAHVPFEEVAPDPRAVAQRFAVRQRMIQGDRPSIIVTSASALNAKWMARSEFAASCSVWRIGDELARPMVTEFLLRCGYQAVPNVEDEGTFVLRGDVVDIFVPGARYPQRMEFFGDELVSIKSFEPQTQRPMATATELAIFPIRDLIYSPATIDLALKRLDELAERVVIPSKRLRLTREEIAERHYFFGAEALWPLFYSAAEPVLDSLLGDGTQVVLVQSQAVYEAVESRYQRAEHEYLRAQERHQIVAPIDDHMLALETVAERLNHQPRIYSEILALDASIPVLPLRLGDFSQLAIETKARRADMSRGEILDPLVEVLKRSIERQHDYFLTSPTEHQAERLRELLIARKIDLPILRSLPPIVDQPRTQRSPYRAIVVAPLSHGVYDQHNGIALLSEIEIFGVVRPVKRKKQKVSADALSTLRDLREGELVIHIDHGIGRYLGLKRLMLSGVEGDYVHLEYAEGDKLYVPVYRLNVLQKYRGGTAHVKLDKLGGTRWEKAKTRVKDAVLHLAHELLALQAQRKLVPGLKIAPPNDHFRAFEATFPYEETPDQERAIRDVLNDLCSGTPVDRLVCGDVGFGKTEVAIRAAYLTALSGKQVAILVPTTVLAEQHRNTFHDRLHGEGVCVEVLSRFRSVKETREVVAGLHNGSVDIVIGTHRLLSHDIAFKDLGLLIVDEEQRFGVKHKERLKQFKAHVNILTLSATPIPRTLHMATVGLRDLSIIQTPPTERMAIRTEVARFDEELITEAVRRELQRGGQVFVVHNRVQSIGSMANLIGKLVPEARVMVAHGQMTGEELERIMVDFVRHEYNVLVCTAIIESGIDIPSVNTMIVNRADTFGLSQLHQLRGRIGRGRERGYAYLLLPRSEQINREAAERLAVLKRFSELGSGFQIASHDLDLRGAGNLLGADQSGNIAAVGFELYTELLNEAVERAKGLSAEHSIEPEIQLPVTAVIPEAYVPEPMQRLAFYQQLALAKTDEQVTEICLQMEDMYGKAPDELRYLSHVMAIRRRLKKLGATSLSASVDGTQARMSLSFVPSAAVDRQDLVLQCQIQSERYRLLPSGKLAVTVRGLGSDDPAQLLLLIQAELMALRTVT